MENSMMKYMVGLALIVVHGPLEAVFSPAEIMAQAFFKADWMPSAPGTNNTFGLIFRWMPDMPMTYNGKQYKIRSGTLNYKSVQHAGTLKLLEADASGKLQTVLSGDLTAPEFKNFSKTFDTAKGGKFLLETPTTQGPELKNYTMIKDLILLKFPGLQIG
jgi:hypothetical protein